MNETIKTELYHKWSPSKKHDYNVQYYKRNKDKWEKYRFSDRETMGDNETRIRKAENALADARNRYNLASDLRTEAFKAAVKNKNMAARAQAAGIPKAAEALRSTAYDKYGEARDYLGQQNYIKKKQIDPREGGVSYLRSLRDKGYGDAASRPAPSARVEGSRALKRKTVQMPSGVHVTNTSKLGNLDWKLKPVKNKATRKAKEFVSNWKSGANSIKSTVGSASSKAGKSFLDSWKSGAKSIGNTKIPGVTRTSTTVVDKLGTLPPGANNYRSVKTTKRPLTIGEAISGMRGSKRTFDGQPKGFVENWKQGAGDIKNAITKKRKRR